MSRRLAESSPWAAIKYWINHFFELYGLEVRKSEIVNAHTAWGYDAAAGEGVAADFALHINLFSITTV